MDVQKKFEEVVEVVAKYGKVTPHGYVVDYTFPSVNLYSYTA